MFSTSNQLFTPPRLLQDGLDQNTIETAAKFAHIFTLCPKNNVAGMFLLRQEFYVLTLVGAVQNVHREGSNFTALSKLPIGVQ